MVRKVMEDRVSYPNPYYPLLKDTIIIDEAQDHYIHIFMGWEEEQFFYRTLIHIQVRDDGKIHILTNNTDTLIEEDLMEAGITKSSILCGYDIPPEEVKTTLGVAA